MKEKETEMENFLKQNVMDVVSKRYNYDPQSIEYLKNIKGQLKNVMAVVDETIEYMLKVQKIKDERNGIVYPFDEGDDYWVIEDGRVVFSCWDDISEENHRKNPLQEYFMTEKSAREYLNKK